MRHHKANRKFGRIKKVREGLLKSLLLSLVTKGKIMTTDAKARELRSITEKLVTMAKKDTLASNRMLISKIGKTGASKLTKDLAPKFKDRKGGYLRISKLPQRKSDGSFMSYIEFVS